MALEDFTTYTETDTAERLTVTENKIDIIALVSDEVATVVYDFGVNYFGDFVIRFKYEQTTLVPAPVAYFGIWQMTADENFTLTQADTNTEGIAMIVQDVITFQRLGVIDHELTNFDYNDYADPDNLNGEIRWFELERVDTTLTVKIYTDAYSTLEDTLTITIMDKGFRYMMFPGMADANTDTITASIEDMEIVSVSAYGAGVGVVRPNFRMSRASRQEINMYGPPSTGMGQSM